MANPQFRRSFLKRFIVPATVTPIFVQQTLLAQDSATVPAPAITRDEPKRPARLSAELVREFVMVSHGKKERVRQLLAEQPKLVYASWDQGGGDWETGLGAASHVGRRDIANLLLDHGARKDIFAAAMLGETEVVRAMVKLDPKMALQVGPHGYRVLYHAAISGEVAMAESVLAPIEKKKPHLSQALFAAVRGGHFEMTEWLLAKGAASVNKANAIGETPLRTATRRGDAEMVELLRKHGATQAD